MTKYALLIGISKYEHDGLQNVPGASNDIKGIRKILLNPDIGGFEPENVKLLEDPNKAQIDDEIYDLFDLRKKSDLILFYFAGHGLTESDGHFYLSAYDTRKNSQGKLREITAISAKYLHERMNKSFSEQQVLFSIVALGALLLKE